MITTIENVCGKKTYALCTVDTCVRVCVYVCECVYCNSPGRKNGWVPSWWSHKIVFVMSWIYFSLSYSLQPGKVRKLIMLSHLGGIHYSILNSHSIILWPWCLNLKCKLLNGWEISLTWVPETQYLLLFLPVGKYTIILQKLYNNHRLRPRRVKWIHSLRPSGQIYLK